MKRFFVIIFLLLELSLNLKADIYTDSSVTFTYPSYWKLINKNDTIVKFDAGKSFTFTITHQYGYDGDEVKFAEDRKTGIEKSGGVVTIESSDLGNVFAVKMTEEDSFKGEPMRYIYYLYRDRKSYNEDPVMVSAVSYGGKASDFAEIEPQCINVYKSIKWQMRISDKPGKYYFEYPVSCSVKEFTAHSQYVTTNAPIVRNNGSALQGFFIGETPPNDSATVDSAVKLKRRHLRYEGCTNIIIRDTTIGGKPGKVIHYITLKGATGRLFYVGLKGSLYWFSFEPTKEAANHSFYEAADLIMRTFRFED